MASRTPQELKQLVADYSISKGWDESDNTLEEILLYDDCVYKELQGSHRWWDDEFRVVDVGGLLIGCFGARTTGDRTPREVGWEFDWNSLVEVEKKEVIKTVYEIKK